MSNIWDHYVLRTMIVSYVMKIRKTRRKVNKRPDWQKGAIDRPANVLYNNKGEKIMATKNKKTELDDMIDATAALRKTNEARNNVDFSTIVEAIQKASDAGDTSVTLSAADFIRSKTIGKVMTKLMGKNYNVEIDGEALTIDWSDPQEHEILSSKEE